MLPSSPPRRRRRCGDSLARRRDRGWTAREPRGPGRGGRGAASGVRRSERRAPFGARRPELRGNGGGESRPGEAAGGVAGAHEGRRKGRPFCMEVWRREASTFSKVPSCRRGVYPSTHFANVCTSTPIIISRLGEICLPPPPCRKSPYTAPTRP